MCWLFVSCVLVLTLCEEVFSSFPHSWDYANLHCRSEDNEPLDWWFIYKPPAEWFDSNGGRSYVFLSSDNTDGNFVTAKKNINRQSMPFFTVNSLFRTTYLPHLASLKFTYHTREKPAAKTTTNYLLADITGGVWMGTSVRGYVPDGADRPYFSMHELLRGQTMFCLTLGVSELNELGTALRRASTDVTGLRVPTEMEQLVPAWERLRDKDGSNNATVQKLHLQTQGGLDVVVLFAAAGGSRAALTDVFARTFGVVLDVYEGATGNATSRCGDGFGRREIRQISLTSRDSSYVRYVNKDRDRGFFAVSTAASWQRAGAAGPRHWACFGSPEREPRADGFLLCANNEAAWRALTNLKVAEPEC